MVLAGTIADPGGSPAWLAPLGRGLESAAFAADGAVRIAVHIATTMMKAVEIRPPRWLYRTFSIYSAPNARPYRTSPLTRSLEYREMYRPLWMNDEATRTTLH